MTFEDAIRSISKQLKEHIGGVNTEQGTKTAFVLPFINVVLGYDIFNPSEVVPEYICDMGIKKGEKIDYAILKGGCVQIIMECKKIGDSLDIKHASQLFRYFHATSARIGVLTNGRCYKFYTDLDTPNKMDEKPFLELDLLDIDTYILPELKKLTKQTFDVDSVVSAAEELKYIMQLKKQMNSMFSEPDGETVRLFASRIYDGKLTKKVVERFGELLMKAGEQLITEKVNERLNSAITGASAYPLRNGEQMPQKETQQVEDEDTEEENKIVANQDKINGFLIVRAIVCKTTDVSRIVMRDAQSYCAILFDNNNRKPICRLHFNRKQKYLAILDENKTENKVPIESVLNIYNYSDAILATVNRYL